MNLVFQGKYFKQYHVNFYAYADDNQLYVHCCCGRCHDMTSAVDKLERCLTGVSHWMYANRLKLNAEKTEQLWTGLTYHAAVLGSNGSSLRRGDEIVVLSDHVRLLAWRL